MVTMNSVYAAQQEQPPRLLKSDVFTDRILGRLFVGRESKSIDGFFYFLNRLGTDVSFEHQCRSI